MSLWRVVVTFLCLSMADISLAHASPWAEPGDAQLRSDIETLKKYGLISGPITTWPLPWKQILSHLDDDVGEPLPEYVSLALARVRDKAPREEDIGSLKFSSALQATNKPALVRSFGDTARDKVDAEASAEIHGSSTAARITVGYNKVSSDQPHQGKVNLDGSYLAQALGNWVVYGGWVDRWWGPGRESALMFSTNARPMLTIGLSRLEPKPFGTKLLSWLGPWQFNMTVSRMETARDYPHTLIAALRVSISPIKNLDLGVSRLMQMCGQGRPCGLSVWEKSLLPFGRVLNRPGPNDPGNQQASFDASYNIRLSPYNFMNLYFEMNGEDGATVLATKYARLFGASLSGPWAYNGAQWRLTVETSDTYSVLEPWGGSRQPAVLYNHFVYSNGLRYFGRVLGASLDSDSLLRTIDGSITDTHGRVYSLKFHQADINRILGTPDVNKVSGDHEKMNIVEAGLELPTEFGKVNIEVRYQTDSTNTPGRKVGSAQAEVRWGKAF
jgi:hypothetical protein